jgi:hypothetical protein
LLEQKTKTSDCRDGFSGVQAARYAMSVRPMLGDSPQISAPALGYNSCLLPEQD